MSLDLLAITEKAWRGLDPCGVLVSYWAMRNGDLPAVVEPWRERGVPVFADSGAFTANSQKQVIDVNAYADWLGKYRDLFSVYANLDVIGNAEGSQANLDVLEAAGLAPLPVFHVNEPWSELDRLAEQYDRVALGGIVSFKRGGAVGPWIAQAFRLVNGRAQLHGFGVTRWQFLRDFPWDTVDSTTWLSGARYGAQLVWNGHRLIQLDKVGLVKAQKQIEAQHHISVGQAVRAATGDTELGYRVGLQAMALAQANRRRHVPGFTIYCSGVT